MSSGRGGTSPWRLAAVALMIKSKGLVFQVFEVARKNRPEFLKFLFQLRCLG